MKYFLTVVMATFLLPQISQATDLSVDCKHLKRNVVNSWSSTIPQPSQLDKDIMGVTLRKWTKEHSKKLAIGFQFCMKDAVARGERQEKWTKGQKRLEHYITELPKTKKQLLNKEKEIAEQKALQEKAIAEKKAQMLKEKSEFETNSALLAASLIDDITSVQLSFEAKGIVEEILGDQFCYQGWSRNNNPYTKQLTHEDCKAVQKARDKKFKEISSYFTQRCDELMDDSGLSKSEQSGYLMSARPQRVRDTLCLFMYSGYNVDFSKSWINFGDPTAKLEIEDQHNNEISVEFSQKDMILDSEMTTVWTPLSISRSDGKKYQIDDAKEVILTKLLNDFFAQ
ncbi:MAG: hypothetical protein MRY49_01715 [Candidatus Pacebacteria bacterium]|nr:hypothetical protein [Candidatus Paceibacterota bacterium]